MSKSSPREVIHTSLFELIEVIRSESRNDMEAVATLEHVFASHRVKLRASTPMVLRLAA